MMHFHVAKTRVAIPLFLMGGLVLAHDLYLKPSEFRPGSGTPIRVAFHNGDSFPESEVAVKPERLRTRALLHAGGRTEFREVKQQGKETLAVVTAPAANGSYYLISETVPNFIQLEAAKFEEYVRHEGLDHILVWRKRHGETAKPGRETYSKYVKSLGYVGAPDAFYARPAGLAIEFVPLVAPASVKPGQMLPVKVLVRGIAASGLLVQMSYLSANGGKAVTKNVGRTNLKGEVSVPLESAGFWKLHTLYMERRKDTTEADWESLWASLTFDVQ